MKYRLGKLVDEDCATSSQKLKAAGMPVGKAFSIFSAIADDSIKGLLSKRDKMWGSINKVKREYRFVLEVDDGVVVKGVEIKDENNLPEEILDVQSFVRLAFRDSPIIDEALSAEVVSLRKQLEEATVATDALKEHVATLQLKIAELNADDVNLAELVEQKRANRELLKNVDHLEAGLREVRAQRDSLKDKIIEKEDEEKVKDRRLESFAKVVALFEDVVVDVLSVDDLSEPLIEQFQLKVKEFFDAEDDARKRNLLSEVKNLFVSLRKRYAKGLGFESRAAIFEREVGVYFDLLKYVFRDNETGLEELRKIRATVLENNDNELNSAVAAVRSAMKKDVRAESAVRRGWRHIGEVDFAVCSDFFMNILKSIFSGEEMEIIEEMIELLVQKRRAENKAEIERMGRLIKSRTKKLAKKLRDQRVALSEKSVLEYQFGQLLSLVESLIEEDESSERVLRELVAASREYIESDELNDFKYRHKRTADARRTYLKARIQFWQKKRGEDLVAQRNLFADVIRDLIGGNEEHVAILGAMLEQQGERVESFDGPIRAKLKRSYEVKARLLRDFLSEVRGENLVQVRMAEFLLGYFDLDSQALEVLEEKVRNYVEAEAGKEKANMKKRVGRFLDKILSEKFLNND